MLMLALIAAGCTQQKYEYDHPAEIKTPTDDLLLERLDLPATVIGSSFSPIGQALINRLAIKDDIDEHTMVVIFSDNSGCSTETYEQAMKVYDRGGVIVFDNPSPDKA